MAGKVGKCQTWRLRYLHLLCKIFWNWSRCGTGWDSTARVATDSQWMLRWTAASAVPICAGLKHLGICLLCGVSKHEVRSNEQELHILIFRCRHDMTILDSFLVGGLADVLTGVVPVHRFQLQITPVPRHRQPLQNLQIKEFKNQVPHGSLHITGATGAIIHL